MSYTDVSELCKAVQNIEMRDLRRVVNKMGGSFDFTSLPENVDGVHYVEFYNEEDGPTSSPIVKVKVEDDKVYLMFRDYPGWFPSDCAFPGHLCGVTHAIIEISQQISRVMKTYEITLFVLGLPYNPNNTRKVTVKAPSQKEAEEKAHEKYVSEGWGVYDSKEVELSKSEDEE